MRWSLVWLLPLCFVLLGADQSLWRARRRPQIRPNKLAAMRVSPGDWAKEPAGPQQVDEARFARALNELCGWMPRARPGNYARWTLSSAREFGIDPFVLGALIFRESRCRPRDEQLGGLGLTLIAPRMYQSGFHKRSYHYRVRVNGKWQDRKKVLDRFPFSRHRMLQAESNLYFAAALLSVWREQHETVDHAFEQVPHRHYVSHWVWGDRVRSARAEDRIFTDRRRLLEYYGALDRPAPLQREGLTLGSPLDGAPRVVSSGLGSRRDGGRAHRGIDLESDLGEPVRAIADGRVVFSGVDLPGSRHNENLEMEQTNAFDREALGRGGRYLCIRHPRSGQDSLRSCYMHLETVEVVAGTELKRGQRIGTVGRTGMKRSSPHLHLEIHATDRRLDPLQVLAGYVIGRPVEFKQPRRRRPRASQ